MLRRRGGDAGRFVVQPKGEILASLEHEVAAGTKEIEDLKARRCCR